MTGRSLAFKIHANKRKTKMQKQDRMPEQVEHFKTSWTREKLQELYELPFFELITQAYAIHSKSFPKREIEFCTLSNIKTGACPEDCAYCTQSAHYNTGLKKQPLLKLDEILEQARVAKANGSKRFCMGAAWRSPNKRDFPIVLEAIKKVKEEGMETCVTLGLLNLEQAQALKEAGLDYYNHNLDSSEEFYKKIITTRCYQDRLDTISNVVTAGLNVCCGAILGMGEAREDRIGFLLKLKELPEVPKSIPINNLIPMEGTPLADQEPIDNFEFIKTIAITRIMFPTSKVRLSAGREKMNEEMQAWCFMAGANSIFIGDKLLTAKNPELHQDKVLLNKLNLAIEA